MIWYGYLGLRRLKSMSWHSFERPNALRDGICELQYCLNLSNFLAFAKPKEWQQVVFESLCQIQGILLCCGKCQVFMLFVARCSPYFPCYTVRQHGPPCPRSPNAGNLLLTNSTNYFLWKEKIRNLYSTELKWFDFYILFRYCDPSLIYWALSFNVFFMFQIYYSLYFCSVFLSWTTCDMIYGLRIYCF